MTTKHITYRSTQVRIFRDSNSSSLLQDVRSPLLSSFWRYYVWLYPTAPGLERHTGPHHAYTHQHATTYSKRLYHPQQATGPWKHHQLLPRSCCACAIGCPERLAHVCTSACMHHHMPGSLALTGAHQCSSLVCQCIGASPFLFPHGISKTASFC